MDKLKIKYKLWIIVAIALVSLVLTELVFLVSLRDDLSAQKQLTTKSAVETAFGIVDYAYRNAKSGNMTEEAAQQHAKDMIKKLRYAGGEYFWINDMKPSFVAHPYPDMDQKDVSDLKDATGKRMIVEMVEKVKKEGAGYVNYLWSRQDSERPVRKISYVKGFEPWG